MSGNKKTYHNIYYSKLLSWEILVKYIATNRFQIYLIRPMKMKMQFFARNFVCKTDEYIYGFKEDALLIIYDV